MLQIEYKGKFLHLAAGSAIEIDKSSSLFLIDNILAEFTMPVTIMYDDHNAAILGDLFFDYGLKAKQKLSVAIYDNGTYCSQAVMVIDKNLVNNAVRGRGNVQGYLLTGISDFFSTIKDRKLNTLMLGGVHSFPFTSWDAFDASDGWWQHFHATWDGSFDYVMIPHRNESWIEQEWFDGWVNQLGYGYLSGLPQFAPGSVEQDSAVVLFPFFKVVLEKLFTENGWTVDTSGLQDNDWQKLVLFNCNPITTITSNGSDPGTITPVARLAFQLSDTISPEIYCTDFLLWTCKRYGWAPIFDSDTKNCRLVALKNCTAGTVKDFTRYATAELSTDYSQPLRKFSFVNNLPAGDSYPSTPDFTNYKIQPPVASFAVLPVPSVNYDTSLIFCFKENAYYKIDVDADANRIWIKHSDNIYNEEIQDATDSFETGCTTLPIQRSIYRETIDGTKFYGYFPICKQPRNKQWGLRTLFYHGMVLEQAEDGTAGSMEYPLASPVAVLPDGSIVTAWSNVYKHDNGTADYGIIKYWWEEWLRILKVSNAVETTLNLPLHILAALKWDDIINIRNQPYLIKKYIEPRPYLGSIQATLHPLLLDDNDKALVGDTALIYLKISFENETAGSSPYFDNLQLCDVIVSVFSDAAGTVPTLPGSLIINMIFKAVPVATGIPVYGGAEQHTIENAVNIIWPGAIREFDSLGTSDHYIWGYDLLPGTGYTVIP